MVMLSVHVERERKRVCSKMIEKAKERECQDMVDREKYGGCYRHVVERKINRLWVVEKE